MKSSDSVACVAIVAAVFGAVLAVQWLGSTQFEATKDAIVVGACTGSKPVAETYCDQAADAKQSCTKVTQNGSVWCNGFVKTGCNPSTSATTNAEEGLQYGSYPSQDCPKMYIVACTWSTFLLDCIQDAGGNFSCGSYPVSGRC